MKNILLKIKYDGSNFSGWQIQPRERTVQGELEKALSHIFREKIRLQGSSRTDSGVHALGQCACFNFNSNMPKEKITSVVNNFLRARSLVGPDLEVISAEEVAEDFHPRYHALGKRYIYKIAYGQKPDLFKRNYFYQLEESLDVDKMQEATKALLGKHDFRSFMAAGSNIVDDTERTIYKARFSQQEDNSLIFEIIGDGFLYNMVRIIVGTLIDISREKLETNSMAEIIKSKNRSKSGHTAPPGGLYLEKVFFSREELEYEN